MANDIIKREIIDSEDSKKAKKEIDRIYKKLERVKEKGNAASHSGDISGPEEEKTDILAQQELLKQPAEAR
jgi:hypothetical protein